MHRTTLGKYGLLIAHCFCPHQDFGANRMVQPFPDDSKDLISQFGSQAEYEYPGTQNYRDFYRPCQSLPYFTEQVTLHFCHCLPTVVSILLRSHRNLPGSSKYALDNWSAFFPKYQLIHQFHKSILLFNFQWGKKNGSRK